LGINPKNEYCTNCSDICSYCNFGNRDKEAAMKTGSEGGIEQGREGQKTRGAGK
jgi:2-iminoacetate synthase ThiH